MTRLVTVTFFLDGSAFNGRELGVFTICLTLETFAQRIFFTTHPVAATPLNVSHSVCTLPPVFRLGICLLRDWGSLL